MITAPQERIEMQIALIGDDPLIQFIGEGGPASNRDHGHSRRVHGRNYVRTGFVFIEDGAFGYYEHPETKEKRNALKGLPPLK